MFTAAKLMRNYLQYTHMWWFQFAETFLFLVGSWNLALSYMNTLHQMHPLKDHVTIQDDEESKPWFEAESSHSLKSNPHSEGCKARYIQVNNEASIKPVQHVNTSRAILIHKFWSLVPLVWAGCTTTLHSFVSICNFEGLRKSFRRQSGNVFRIFTLTSSSFCISTPILILEFRTHLP